MPMSSEMLSHVSIPFIKGQALCKACTGPVLVYWPRVNSMNTNGTTQRHITVMYGMRKAPGGGGGGYIKYVNIAGKHLHVSSTKLDILVGEC